MLKRFLIGCVLVASASVYAKPHVLFIAVDDLNDWVGCLDGHPQALTPNMDRLAARGVLFRNAHCASPACNPSRSAVFTGLMPDKTKVWSNRSSRSDRVYKQAVQLPQAFAKAGYHTMGTGKLLHSKGGGYFDEYYSVEQRWSPLPAKSVLYTNDDLSSKGSEHPRHVTQDSLGREVVLPLNRMPSDRAPDKVAGESHDWGAWDVPDSDFGDTQITDWAIKQLGAEREQPLFMGVGYYRPHIPLWAPKRFFDRFEKDPGQLPPIKENDLDDLSEAGKKWALEAVTAGSHASTVKHGQWQAAVEAYLACVTYVDHEVGRLVDALDVSKMADDTWIVLWSDHGWQLGEKEHWGKWTGWERSTKVVLMVVPPRQLAAKFASGGSVCDQPVGLIDLYPTLTQLCGVSAPESLDGQSLVPLLRKPDQQTGRAVLTQFDQGNTSLRTERWRYIRYADGSEELYDMQKDPNEWDNLAGSPEYREVMERLRIKFKEVP